MVTQKIKMEELQKPAKTTEETTETKIPLYAVYGTLRAGYGNHRLLNNEHCRLMGRMTTPANYKMISLGAFPGVILNGNQEVVVEIYSVNSKEVEARLDMLEGYPRFYQKTKIETPWGTANMYILSEENYGNYPVVESGDWNIHTRREG